MIEVFLDEPDAYNREGFVFHDTRVDIQDAAGTRFCDILVGDAGTDKRFLVEADTFPFADPNFKSIETV